MSPDGADDILSDVTYGEILFAFTYEFARDLLILTGLLVGVALVIVAIAMVITVVLLPLFRRLVGNRQGVWRRDDRQPQEPASWWLGEGADLPVRQAPSESDVLVSQLQGP